MPLANLTPERRGPHTTQELDYDLGSFVIQPIDGVFVPIESSLSGLITHPQALNPQAKAPLVILAHGRHSASVENFRGLAYLAHHLSSYGYICASIDLNALVGPQGTLSSRRPPIVVGGAIVHRAVTILRTIVALQDHPTVGPFTNFKNVGLIGHSRGAEAVARACAMNLEGGGLHGIQAVFSIAPVDFTGVHLAAPFFLLYGNIDGDVSDGQSFRIWDRASKDKHGFYIHGAIHNYFSLNWDNEWDSPDDRTLSREKHETLAKVMALSFMERYLRRESGYDELLRGVTSIPELSNIRLERMYEGQDQFVIDTNQGPFDASTNSLGMEAHLMGDGSIRELDLERFKVDTIGLQNTFAEYRRYHKYLSDPRYTQYREYLRSEIAGMVRGFIEMLRYFAGASGEPVRGALRERLIASIPEFDYNVSGWELLEDRLNTEDAQWLEQLFEFVEENNQGQHAWNQATKGLAIDWRSRQACYVSRIGDFDARPFRFLRFRVGQNYRSNNDPMLNTVMQDQDFSVMLEDVEGRSQKLALGAVDGVVFAPWTDAKETVFKSSLRTVLLPLELFSQGDDGVDLNHLAMVGFLFDQVPEGSIIVDDIAFSN